MKPDKAPPRGKGKKKEFFLAEKGKIETLFSISGGWRKVAR